MRLALLIFNNDFSCGDINEIDDDDDDNGSEYHDGDGDNVKV